MIIKSIILKLRLNFEKYAKRLVFENSSFIRDMGA